MEWYLSDEVITALARYRASPDVYPLIPVVLEASASIPRGLGQLQAIDATTNSGLTEVATKLKERMTEMEQSSPRDLAALGAARPGVAVARAGSCDHFRVHQQLCRLNELAFEQLVRRVDIEPTLIAPRGSPVAERALDAALQAALDDSLCRRLAMKLYLQARS